MWLSRNRQSDFRLSEHWASYRVFDLQKDVPWTNNGTEQAIGRMKACPERSEGCVAAGWIRIRLVTGEWSWVALDWSRSDSYSHYPDISTGKSSKEGSPETIL
jgi:hypothetical protein